MKNLMLVMALSAIFSFPDFDSAVLLLSGASSLEELDESTLQHYRDLASRPVDLNASGRSRLLASGLLNAFQTASLLDWRKRSGDILSYTELGLIDGFSPEYAEALSYFTTLESSRPPGEGRIERLHHDFQVRASARWNDSGALAAGLRYKASLGNTAEFNWASRTTYSDKTIRPGTFSGAWYGRRWLGKVVLGHFNARFGQGLAQWSGFSVSRFSSVGSFRRNGSGFTPTSSFSPEYCGIAADFDLGRWNLAAAYSLTGNKPMAYASYTGQRFSAGAFASDKCVSAEFKLGLKNTAIFGEAAWTGSPAALLGAIRTPLYGVRYALVAVWEKGAPAAAAGCAVKDFEGVLSADGKQTKLSIKYAPELSAGKCTLKPAVRLGVKQKDSLRLEGRCEFGLAAGPFALNSRFDITRCKGLSWLVYLESGYAVEHFKIWLRGTLFCVDNWDDRIYVYERDAPGNFNVPAYYGRGWNCSLTSSLKINGRQTLYLRALYQQYPWMTIEKASKAEVKLQYNLKF